MWIKAILPLGALALAAVLRPVPVPAPASPVLAAKPAADIAFQSICRDGVLPESRPDAAWVAAGVDGCRLAAVPAAFDGAAAPREKIVAAMTEAKRYDRAAASFQQCVSGFVAAHRQLTPAQRLIEAHRLAAGQKARDFAAAQMRGEIEAFNMYGIDCSG
ncbi:MAG: hypothetical protein JO256_01675 [Alphaproteobacteria bacterium]|nr:hypothetical protein [Alphaproteobacteria bacterium]